jgi:fatty-acyl-CoA synthase
MSFTIGSTLRWWLRETPDATAIEVDGEALSFFELHHWSGRIAQALLDEGIRTGDFVTMIGVNSLEYAVLIVALVRIGVIGAPLTFRSSAPDIIEAVDSFNPKAIYCDTERFAMVETVLAASAAPVQIRNFTSLRALRNGPAASPDVELDRDAPLFIINTSGSTAKSKAVVSTNFAVMTYACEFLIMEPSCGRGAKILSLCPSSEHLALMAA